MKFEKDDFVAWRELALTKFVFDSLKKGSDDLRSVEQEQLLGQAQRSPGEWAALQANAAYVKGFADATDQLFNLTLEQLQDDDDTSGDKS